ncbi:MAG: sodium:calcium antiporter [Bacteroidetes bacterium]|nr:MAG: sodium:calcium antiporter [Bacteroidota bacterium]REJ99990.1 MAG: sodium:calcium antiporter [Bacteroidota bacterium]REK35830.1 MAG: sodium:calcium antiporter [Bacteroidota bacterium]REK49299.1 MAG: sodium:calcium antiporter [Bacteroidota bacterium]
MSDIILYLAGFIGATALIVVGGSRLSRYGDMLADMLGWGKMFMGIMLMASVTSLPELMTGISSVALVDAPDLAVGDIVGSCAFNILIISIMDLFYNPAKPLTSVAQPGHVIAASLGIVMLSIVAVAILMPGVFGHIGWIGGSSILFIILYFIAIRVLYVYEKRHHVRLTYHQESELTLRDVILRYSFNAVLVIAGAMALPYFGKHLAAISGMGQSFFGTLFIAASTSLPEIVVSISAIRLGTIDLAIGNIFGSNIFNIIILAIDDIFHTKGPILLYTSQNHVIPILGTIIITAIGITGILFKSARKWKLAIDSAFILLVYVLMMILLYNVS